jgi:hypothetical protein
MEEIYYKKNLADLTNRQLDTDFQNLFIENRLENYPEELEEHHEIVHRANPQDRVEPAVSRNILFNYMQNTLENEQPIARRRLRGGKKSRKTIKSRKTRRGRKTRKGRKSRRIRRR